MKITAKQYAVAFYEAIKDKKKSEAKPFIKEFANLIYDNNDIFKLNKIIIEFEKVWNREMGIIEAKIVSARELDNKTIKQLKSYVAALTQAKKVGVEEKIDKNLLGGVILRYGDKIIDASLKTKLAGLKEKMSK
jgi:F-type H+-transporting ATPase subunit delta